MLTLASAYYVDKESQNYSFSLCQVLTRARAFAATLGAFVASKAIPSGKNGDAREAAGLGDRWPERTVGAV